MTSYKLHSVRPVDAAELAADVASEARYLTVMLVRVWSAVVCVALYPAEWQICATAVVAIDTWKVDESEPLI